MGGWTLQRFKASRAAWLTGAVLLGVLAGGGGFALAGGSGTIKACVKKHSHVLYTGKCKSGDKKLSWNQMGPKGATGAPGTPATKLFAAINSDGTFVSSQSSGVTASSAIGTGSYQVIFGQNVRGCTYIVSGGQAGSSGWGSAGFYNATGRSGNVDGVYVHTYNSSGTSSNNSFYLAVFC